MGGCVAEARKEGESIRLAEIKKLNPARYKRSEKMAAALGDTYLNDDRCSPIRQWFRILSMLESGGYKIKAEGEK